jgi:UDP-N-acetyl-D-mannosaminuronate dehydrogenase
MLFVSVYIHSVFDEREETCRLEQALASIRICPEAISSSDAVVIVTDHSHIDYKMILEHAKLVIDARKCDSALRKPSHQVIMA